MQVLMIGLPASGKSTVSERICKRFNAIHVSADRIRHDFFHTAFTQRIESHVWSIVNEIVEGNLKLGNVFVLDFTNVSKQDRRWWIKMAEEAGVGTIGVWLNVDEELARRRNSLRTEYRVPEASIDRMLEQLGLGVSEDEGFKRLVVFKEPPSDADLEEMFRLIASYLPGDKRHDS